uniref:Calcium channel, voltage-dependent, alpha 2/delta subunit 1a n=1 Tax=Neogobius melanostomus TaxID=47308 RepID=A0A8C6WSV8_9GOBI
RMSVRYNSSVLFIFSLQYHWEPLKSISPMFPIFTIHVDAGRHGAVCFYIKSVCLCLFVCLFLATIILNELNWTQGLEEVFRTNKEDDPTLLWQVFGSATGLLRYFPDRHLNLYCVICFTYILGAASPKDMLILVDASGSVSGLTLKLIRQSVSRMLETLSDDDYVNVVYFNEKAQDAACFSNLVQANVRNKRVLKDAVQRIAAKGITNYKGGFELAFKQLAQVNISRAHCNKIIMLFTDGGEERAEEIFEKYNPKQVRIFTFSVGQHNYDKGPIQWMACANKGYFYEIPSIGAIRLNTQEYLDVLGRPMVKADKKAKQVQWTNVYLDALKEGYLPLTLVSLLFCFQKSQNQLILGVVAIDVSLDDIKRLTPRFTFGPNGYYFAIDPNGYVLLHPNLQPLTAKFDEPVTLDFLDAEMENEVKVKMRKNMIDGQKGEYTMSTLLKSQDERYMDVGQRTYTYTNVKSTDYSLALVLPEYSKHYIRATIGDTITQAKCKSTLKSSLLLADKFDEYGYTFIAPREYCKDLKPPDKDSNNTEFLMEFNNYIDTKTPNNPMCNLEMVNRLLLDAGITSDLIKLWRKTDTPNGVTARFVATDGASPDAGLNWKEEAETYESSFYKRSLENDLYIFTPTPYLDRDNYCIILDDGGFLVMSNRDTYIDQIGRFFGVIDPILMASLVNSSLFTFKNTFDYQSLCDPVKETKAAAGLRSVYVPTIADILNVAEIDDTISDAMRKEVCITEQTQYMFETPDLTFRGTLDCENCSRLYHAEKLPKTNLVFIIADAKHTCTSCDTKSLVQDEQPSDGPNPCEIAKTPRYRKGPDVCFDNNERVSTRCLRSFAEGAQAPRWLLLCSCYCCHCSCAVSGQFHNTSTLFHYLHLIVIIYSLLALLAL